MKLEFGEKQQAMLVSALMLIAVFVASLFGYNVGYSIENPEGGAGGRIGVLGYEPRVFPALKALEDGSASVPSYTFQDDNDTGMYRVGSNNIALTAGGTKALDCTATACTIAGTLTQTGALAADGGLSVDSPAFTVANTTGNVSTTGTLGVTGAASLGQVVITGPTAAATATPALLVDNLGAGNNILSLRDSATPVFVVSNAGVVTGKVLQYASSGSKISCGSSVITGTGTIAHGMATPQYVTASLNSDATGDGARVSSVNASATITLKVWNTALTPAAATTPQTVDWCVVGTP